VPAGAFEMGARDLGATEQPMHRVSIAKPFALGRYEVTFAEWDACVAAGGCQHRPSDRGWGRGDRPVMNVSWNDTQSYLRWLSAKTGRTYRLPSEAEWEYAAHAGTRTAYWWGDAVGRANANCADCGSEFDRRETAPVGSFAASSLGLYNMLGNVAEWVEDCWVPSYRGAPADGSARVEKDCPERVLRGGSFNNDQRYVRAAARFKYDAGVRFSANGFRVVRELP
jgi:formylglycine-generating enzyme required for sulfatase activity